MTRGWAYVGKEMVMRSNSCLCGRRATGVAVLTLAAGWAVTARAALVYSVARETISSVSISPTATISNIKTSSQDSTTVDGSGFANSNVLDAVQAYQGGPPAPAQNSFVRYAPGNPPVSPVGNFTRGDSLLAGTVAGPNSVVAESYLDTSLPGTPLSETGAAGYTLSFTFTPTTTGAQTISYNFSNDLFVSSTGVGAVALGNYTFDFSIKDAAGNIVFVGSTANTNLSLGAPPAGGEIIRSGSESLTTGSLSSGQLYTLTYSSTAQSSVSQTAVAVGTNVPLPTGASSGLVALGILAAVGGVGRRLSFRGMKRANA